MDFKNIDWSKWGIRLGLPLAGVLAIVFVLQIGGCQAVQDLTARVIGAPTKAEKEKVITELDAADKGLEEAKAQIEAMKTAEASAVKNKEAADQRAAFIRNTYAEAAAKLPTLTGAAQDAMLNIMKTLQDQMTQAKNEAQQTAAIVADFQAKVAGYEVQAQQAEAAALEWRNVANGMDAKTNAAIAKAVGFVKFAGDTASNLGVPGAAAASGTAQSVVGGLLATIFGGTTIAGLMASRKQKARAEDAEAAGSAATELKDHYAKAIVVNEKLGLIRDDPEGEKLKAVARAELGEDSLMALRQLKATVVPVDQTPKS